MTATLRLFTIEARRSIALWFVLPMALVGCWYANDRLAPIGVTLWRQSSIQIGETLIVLAPLMGGVAAWAAGRDRRQGLGDLLGTTPLPFSRRILSSWSGIFVWGIAAHLIVATFIIIATLGDQPWGTPSIAPALIGMLTIIASSAIGFMAGSIIPSRFVAPLVPIGLFFTIGLLNSGWFHDDPVTNLSPWTLLDRQLFLNPNSVFYEPAPLHLLPMSLWLTGLTGAAIATIVLVRRRTTMAWTVLASTITLAAVGAGLLMDAYDDKYLFGVPWERTDLVPYTPICVERSIPVCVHPAFESKLERHADRIELLIEPLLGLPGAPTRAEQVPYGDGMYTDGTLTIDPIYNGLEMTALALVQPPVERPPGYFTQHHARPEQDAIARWLAQRVDPSAFQRWNMLVMVDPAVGPVRDPMLDEIEAAVARFSALDPADQRNWLEAHFSDLRAGNLTLGDLP